MPTCCMDVCCVDFLNGLNNGGYKQKMLLYADIFVIALIIQSVYLFINLRHTDLAARAAALNPYSCKYRDLVSHFVTNIINCLQKKENKKETKEQKQNKNKKNS